MLVYKVWDQRFQVQGKTFNTVNSFLSQQTRQEETEFLHFVNKSSGGSGANSEPGKKEKDSTNRLFPSFLHMDCNNYSPVHFCLPNSDPRTAVHMICL